MVDCRGNKPVAAGDARGAAAGGHRARQKRRKVPIATIPQYMRQAVLAIEDRRFYEHPGVDPIRMVGALINERPRQQEIPRRRVHDHAADHQEHVPDARADAHAQASRTVHGARSRFPFTKDQIFELYLNEVVARPARALRHPRRRRSIAHLLRQGRQQRQPRRSRDDRRHHSGAVAHSTVPQSQQRARSPQRSACCPWPRPASSRRPPPRPRRPNR